jgi:integrase
MLVLASRSFTPKINLALNSQAFSSNCGIGASNDIQAIHKWLEQYAPNKATHAAYKKEADRLLLWCIYEKGLPLGDLKVDDLADYFAFLQQPPLEWCTTRANLRQGRNSKNWRPFIGPLSKSAYQSSVRIINSMLNYLVQADYLRTNPIKLMRAHATFSIDMDTHKYRVWERMLEEDEWAAVLKTLQNMPEHNARAIANKARTQFLFAMLYLLGLRINELATHSWNSFRQRDGKWWFFVKGKGGRLGHVPVNDQLLAYVKMYRLHLKKRMLPDIHETEPIICSETTGNALSLRMLYNLIKQIGESTAAEFSQDSRRQEKLRKFSPHWLRHLSASHQSKAGISLAMIQANHRHSSSQTTQIYVHAEDDARFDAMQKINMGQNNSIVGSREVLQSYNLRIELKGGGVDPQLSFRRFTFALENNIFKCCVFTRSFNEDEISNLLTKSLLVGSEIKYNYSLQNINKNILEKLNVQITRESEIRLFMLKTIWLVA